MPIRMRADYQQSIKSATRALLGSAVPNIFTSDTPLSVPCTKVHCGTTGTYKLYFLDDPETEVPLYLVAGSQYLMQLVGAADSGGGDLVDAELTFLF